MGQEAEPLAEKKEAQDMELRLSRRAIVWLVLFGMVIGVFTTLLMRFVGGRFGF